VLKGRVCEITRAGRHGDVMLHAGHGIGAALAVNETVTCQLRLGGHRARGAKAPTLLEEPPAERPGRSLYQLALEHDLKGIVARPKADPYSRRTKWYKSTRARIPTNAV